MSLMTLQTKALLALLYSETVSQILIIKFILSFCFDAVMVNYAV